MRLPEVGFDESGNTGEDLLNASQPIFGLGSVHFSEGDQRQLDELFAEDQGAELHFNRLKRRRAGREMVLRFFNSNFVTDQTVKLNVVHKRFMITTKIVDMLVEPLFYSIGVDLYMQGANLALANLHHTVLPSFFGEDALEKMHRLFIAMVRHPSRSATKAFYQHVDGLRRQCSVASYKRQLETLLETETVFEPMEDSEGPSEFDPAIPSFVLRCDEWSKTLDTEFLVKHDRSRIINSQREAFEHFMTPDESRVEFGYDRRKMSLPFLARGISFVDSHENKLVQYADLASGAIAYWAAAKEAGMIEDPFFKALEASRLPTLVFGVIWPSDAVTPEDLGTTEVGGENIVDYLATFLKRQKARKK